MPNCRRLSPVTILLLFHAAAGFAQPPGADRNPPALPGPSNPPSRPLQLPLPEGAGQNVRDPDDGIPRTDIRLLIADVADRESIRFFVDPRVRAQVTVLGTAFDDLNLGSLLTILRVHAFVAVPTPEGYMVVPSTIMRSLAVPNVPEDDPSIPDAAVVSRMIDVGPDAAEFVPILRPLVPAYGHLSAIGDQLIIVDHYDNVRRLTGMIDELGNTGSGRRR